MALPLAPLIYFGLRKGATVPAKRGAKYLAKRAAKKAAKKGKKEKPKKKYMISRKKLREMGEKETEGGKIDYREVDSTQEEFKTAYAKLKPKTQASVKR